MDIGDKIKSWRKAKKLTLKDIADNAGVAKSTLSDIENNKKLPTLRTLIPLVLTYGFSVDWLITGDVSSNLSNKEIELLGHYNRLNEDNKLELLVRAKLMHETQQLKKLTE